MRPFKIWQFDFLQIAHRYKVYFWICFSLALSMCLRILDCCWWNFVGDSLSLWCGSPFVCQHGSLGVVLWPWLRKSLKITGCSSIFGVRQHVTFTAGGLILARQTTKSNPVIALGSHLKVYHTLYSSVCYTHTHTHAHYALNVTLHATMV